MAVVAGWIQGSGWITAPGRGGACPLLKDSDRGQDNDQDQADAETRVPTHPAMLALTGKWSATSSAATTAVRGRGVYQRLHVDRSALTVSVQGAM